MQWKQHEAYLEGKRALPGGPNCNLSIFQRQEGAAVAWSSVHLFWRPEPVTVAQPDSGDICPRWKIGSKEQKASFPQTLLIFTLHNVELYVYSEGGPHV